MTMSKMSSLIQTHPEYRISMFENSEKYREIRW
jgi:hypothetical protein